MIDSMAVKGTLVVVGLGCRLGRKCLLGRLWHMQRRVHAQRSGSSAGRAGGIGRVVVVISRGGLGEGAEVVHIYMVVSSLRNAHCVAQERLGI